MAESARRVVWRLTRFMLGAARQPGDSGGWLTLDAAVGALVDTAPAAAADQLLAFGREQAQRFAALDQERPNVLASLQWLADAERRSDTYECTETLSAYLEARGLWGERFCCRRVSTYTEAPPRLRKSGGSWCACGAATRRRGGMAGRGWAASAGAAGRAGGGSQAAP
jgi:hypothetical protein